MDIMIPANFKTTYDARQRENNWISPAEKTQYDAILDCYEKAQHVRDDVMDIARELKRFDGTFSDLKKGTGEVFILNEKCSVKSVPFKSEMMGHLKYEPEKKDSMIFLSAVAKPSDSGIFNSNSMEYAMCRHKPILPFLGETKEVYEKITHSSEGAGLMHDYEDTAVFYSDGKIKFSRQEKNFILK